MWIFPAISCLTFTIWFQTDFHWLAAFLMTLWAVRIIALRHRETALLSVLFCMILTPILFVGRNSRQTELDSNQTEFIAAVDPETFEMDGELMQFYGKVTAGKSSEELVIRYYLESEVEKEKWLGEEIPQYVFIEGELALPSENTNFNQFNYKNYLALKGIHYELKANTVENIGSAEGLVNYPAAYRVSRFRSRLFQSMDKRLFGKTASYSKTVLFAKRNSIAPETMENYRSTGLIHLLSISGLHIQFIILGINFLLLKAGVTKESSALVLLFVLPVYGVLAGFGIGVFRAVFQSIFRFLFQLAGKPNFTLDNWSFALILAVFIFPETIFSAGFQLSFLLSGSLIVLSDSPWAKELPAWKSGIILSLFISLISVPVLSYHFFEYPWLSLFMNIIFVPLFTWVLFPLIIAVFILSWFLSGWVLFTWLIEFVNILIVNFEMLLESINNFRGMSFVTGRLSIISMLGISFGILCFICSFELRKKKKYRWMLTGISVFLLFLFSARLSPFGFVMMVDVGQGESIVIKPPFTSKAIMIDTGGRLVWQEKEKWQERREDFTIGKDILAPVLKSEGISSIERLYLTHGDVDHVGEISELVSHIPIKEAASTKAAFLSENIQSQSSTLAANNVGWKLIEAPEQHNPLSIPISVLHPRKLSGETNDDSLVLLSEIGGYRWLFTGDIEEKGEKEITKNYPGLQVDVLNAAHHGSNSSTSEELLQQLQPKISWISAGKNNPYGHPHADVINRLKNNRITVFRTDADGAVKYTYSSLPFITKFIKEFKTNHDTIEKRGGFHE